MTMTSFQSVPMTQAQATVLFEYVDSNTIAMYDWHRDRIMNARRYLGTRWISNVEFLEHYLDDEDYLTLYRGDRTDEAWNRKVPMSWTLDKTTAFYHSSMNDGHGKVRTIKIPRKHLSSLIIFAGYDSYEDEVFLARGALTCLLRSGLEVQVEEVVMPVEIRHLGLDALRELMDSI